MKLFPPLKIQFPSQGYAQFLTARKELLDSYDRAYTLARGHRVQTFHGNVAEAQFRKWLSGFLPKKYAVTSGYIISQGVAATEKLPHFDVIIYEHLEAPILWIEENPDSSTQGKSLAIPAEYVRGILEVKSAFSSTTVKDAIEHLEEVSHLMAYEDTPNDRYKMYFPAKFFCGTVFFELRIKNSKEKMALNRMVNVLNLKNFIGGLILRGEGHKKGHVGHISILRSETAIQFIPNEESKNMLNCWAISDSIEVQAKYHLVSHLMWAENYFAKFAFDLLELLNGSYKPGSLSSFHAMGYSEFNEE